MQETQVWSLGWKDSPGGRNGNPIQYSCLGNPMDRGAWQGTAHGVTKELDVTYQLNNNNWTHTHTHTYTHTHTHDGILFSHKKEGSLDICSIMDGTWGHYAKWNKSDKERQISYDLIYMWNLKNQRQKSPQTPPLQRTGWWLPDSEGKVEGGQKLQTSSYKIN